MRHTHNRFVSPEPARRTCPGDGAVYQSAAEGQRTREVVHDLKNLLTPILGYVQLVLHDMPQNDAQYKRIEKIQRAAMSARDLVLHALSDPHAVSSVASLDVNGQIRAFVETVDGMIPDGVRLELDLAVGVGNVSADVRNVQRVLMNLIANACQSMPDGGVLNIQTAHIPPRRRQTARAIRISVLDTGCGMEPAVVRRMFETGFTTQPEGNGLGMDCVRRIAHACGGWVEVDSIPGAGTAVHVFLPSAPRATAASKAG